MFNWGKVKEDLPGGYWLVRPDGHIALRKVGGAEAEGKQLEGVRRYMEAIRKGVAA